MRWTLPGLFLLLATAAVAQQERLIAEATVSPTTETAYDVAWHPDGDLLAVTGGFSVTIYDTDLQPITPPLPPQGANLAWSPDGDQLATVEGYGARQIRIWDWDAVEGTVEEAEPLITTDDQYAVAWSPDGACLVTLNDDRGLRNVVTFWDIAARRQVWSVSLPYPQALRVLDWNEDHLRGAGVNADGELILYEIDLENGDATELQPLDSDVILFAFSPDDIYLATITDSGELRIADVESGETRLTLETVETPVNIAWSPDGEKLAVLSYHRELQIWDVADLPA